MINDQLLSGSGFAGLFSRLRGYQDAVRLGEVDVPGRVAADGRCFFDGLTFRRHR